MAAFPPAPMIRAAAIQASPSYDSIAATVAKTCDLITSAAAQGVQLLAFPEAWLGTGYPLWIWGEYGLGPDAGAGAAEDEDWKAKRDELKELYVRNSVDLGSEEGKGYLARIGECARESGVVVVLGISEAVKGEEDEEVKLYIGQVLIDAEGKVKLTRRKLRPFGLEQMLFGGGGKDDLKNVVEVGFRNVSERVRVGMLSCGEHYNPLFNFNTFSQDEQIHVAGWPPVAPHPGGPVPYAISDEAVAAISRTYAMQSQTFVLHSTSMITDPSIPASRGTEAPHSIVFNTVGGGNARIFAPDGRQLTKDLGYEVEGMVVADLELGWCEVVKQVLNCRSGEGTAIGRGDLLQLKRV